MQKTTRLALIAAAFVAVSAAVQAQQTPAPTAPATPAPAAPAPAQPSEVDQLRQKIGQLQQQALQDPALKPAQDSFNAVIQATMARLDPTATARATRATALNAEVEAARAANDNAKLNQLAEEATALKTFFDALRPRAMADAEVVAARQVFLARVLDKMKEIDPNTQQYVDRLSELQRGATGGSR